jgi:hypothetical protein
MVSWTGYAPRWAAVCWDRYCRLPLLRCGAGDVNMRVQSPPSLTDFVHELSLECGVVHQHICQHIHGDQQRNLGRQLQQPPRTPLQLYLTTAIDNSSSTRSCSLSCTCMQHTGSKVLSA